MCALIITARRHDWRLTMEPGQKQGRTCLCYTYENRAAGGCSFTQVALTRCLLLVIYDILHILAFTVWWNVILLVLIKLEIFRIAHQCFWDSGAPYSYTEQDDLWHTRTQICFQMLIFCPWCMLSGLQVRGSSCAGSSNAVTKYPLADATASKRYVCS